MEENNNMLVRNTDTESDIIFVEDGVTEIGDFAFRGCRLQKIGKDCFWKGPGIL